MNLRTCLIRGTETARFPVGHGTGSYAGISGSGKAVIRFLGIGARNSKGQCNQNAEPVADDQTITGTAHVRL